MKSRSVTRHRPHLCKTRPCPRSLSFRRLSEANQEESAVPATGRNPAPTSPPDRPTFRHRRASDHPHLVIPTHERSEAGGICCPSHGQVPIPTPCHLATRPPHLLSFRRVSEANQEESAVPATGRNPAPTSPPDRPTFRHRRASDHPHLVIPTHERSEAGGICCPSHGQVPIPTPCHLATTKVLCISSRTRVNKEAEGRETQSPFPLPLFPHPPCDI